MGTRCLLDTNTVLDFMGNKLPDKAKTTIAEIIDKEINLSVINKIELLGFSTVEQDLIDFVSYSKVHSIDDEIIEKTIDLRRNYKIKLPDAIIAATSLVNQLTLITRDTKDFLEIEGLKVIDPYNF